MSEYTETKKYLFEDEKSKKIGGGVKLCRNILKHINSKKNL